jgi:hypothetical protein
VKPAAVERTQVEQAPHKHEEFIHRAETTGRWWEDPWWARADCEIHFTVRLDAVQRGAAALREHFDAAWYVDLAKTPRRNLVFPKLCLERSTFALEFIASFGARLERLKDALNLQRPLRALRESDGESAFLELEAAVAFAQCGFEVSFPKEGASKTPDLLAARDGQVISVECKRLGDEQWEDWESVLMRNLSRSLPSEYNGQDIVAQVALNPRLSEVRLGSEEYSAINDAISSAITLTILSAVNSALAKNQLPCEYVINDIARFRIEPKQPELYGGVSGMERSAPSIFRRIFQNGVFRALEQLPVNQPGVIVLFSKHAPSAAFFRLLFDAAANADRPRFDNLVGILVCTLQTWFERPPPTLYMNSFTVHSQAAKHINETLMKTFSARQG